MIKIFHTYRKTIFGLMVVALACLSMTGFGVNLYNDYQRDAVFAVKIDEQIVSHGHFERERSQAQERYRQMFGKNYAQFAEALEANLNQQIVDKIIADALLKREASEREMYAGDEELQNILKEEVFSQGFDLKMYAAILRQLGMTAAQFEADLRDSALRQAYTGLLIDVSFASDQEARAMWEMEETAYTVSHIEFDPVKFESEIKDPEEKILDAFYQDKASDYEEPAKATYQYVAFKPADFLELVQPTDDDIELFYSDHAEDFVDQAKIKARHIQFTYPKESDPAKMAEIKTKAEEVLVKAKAGELFDGLATAYSDDLTSNILGGDLGWLTRGKMAKEFDSVAFKLKAGEVSDLVATDYGFHIIKVEEAKEAEPKKLEDVRAEIVKRIQEREASAYVADHAQKLFDQWNKGDESLVDFAAKNKLVVKDSAPLIGESSDPSPELLGLSKEVLRFPEEQKQLVELKEETVLVSVKEYREPRIPPLAEIKAKVLADYKKVEAKKLAEGAAQSFIKDLQSKTEATLASLAKEWKLKVTETKDISRAKGATGIFSNEEIRRAVFSATSAAIKPSKPYKSGDKLYVVQVTEIKKPELANDKDKLKSYKTRAAQANGQALVASIINRLKAKAQIDVDPHLLATKGA